MRDNNKVKVNTPLKRDSDLRRFSTDASGIQPLGMVTDVVDHTTPEQREANARHDAALRAAIAPPTDSAPAVPQPDLK